jgi:NUMOD3 motif-containing protein
MCGEERPDISKLDSLKVGDKNPMYGRVHSDNSRRNISDGMIRYWEKRRNGGYGNNHKTYEKNKDRQKVRHKAYLKKINPNWYPT